MKQYMVISITKSGVQYAKFTNNWKEVEDIICIGKDSGREHEVYEYEKYRGYTRID